MAHYTFFGQFGGVTRQCSMCHELVIANASSQQLESGDAHDVWSRAFEQHIHERHSVDRLAEDQQSCPTVRLPF